MDKDNHENVMKHCFKQYAESCTGWDSDDHRFAMAAFFSGWQARSEYNQHLTNMMIRDIEGFRFVFINETSMNDPRFTGNFSECDEPVNDWMLIVGESDDECLYLQSRVDSYRNIIEQTQGTESELLDSNIKEIIEHYALALLHWPKTEG